MDLTLAIDYDKYNQDSQWDGLKCHIQRIGKQNYISLTKNKEIYGRRLI